MASKMTNVCYFLPWLTDMDLLAIISISLTLLFLIVIGLNIYNRQHVLLQKRAFWILVVNQLTALILLNILAFELPCMLSVFFGRFMIFTDCMRLIYTANVTVKEETKAKKLFSIIWNKDSNSILYSKWMLAGCLGILSTAVYELVQSFSIGEFSKVCTNNIYTLISFIVSVFAVMPSLFDMLYYSPYEDTSVELACSFTTMTCLVLLFLSRGPIVGDYLNASMFISSLFWGSTFPFFLITRSNFFAKNIISINNCSYSAKSLLQTSERLFCQENIRFLIDYQLYKLNPRDAQKIIEKYILVDSIYELNLNEELKRLVIESSSHLDLVHDEIIELVSSNVICHM